MLTVFRQIQVLIILAGLGPADPAVILVGFRLAATRLSSRQAARTDLNIFFFLGE